MTINDKTDKLFSGSGQRLGTSFERKMSVEIKGAARGNVILQKQVNAVFPGDQVPTDFVVLKATQAIPFGSIIGRLASEGSGNVDYRVRKGLDVTGVPEFD
jgi:hypothetical protein